MHRPHRKGAWFYFTIQLFYSITIQVMNGRLKAHIFYCRYINHLATCIDVNWIEEFRKPRKWVMANIPVIRLPSWKPRNIDFQAGYRSFWLLMRICTAHGWQRSSWTHIFIAILWWFSLLLLLLVSFVWHITQWYTSLESYNDYEHFETIQRMMTWHMSAVSAASSRM